MPKNMFETLKILNENYLKKEKEKENIYAEREVEINKAKKTVISKYEGKINQIDTCITSSKKDLNDYEKIISNCSTFNSQILGKILQNLITTMEGEEYFYQETTHDTKKIEHTFMDHVEDDVCNQVKLIIKKEYKLDRYRSNREFNTEIDQLVNSGRAILLSEEKTGYYGNNDITFYRAYNGQINGLVNFGEFTYVKEFIDEIIEYRIQNNIMTITEKDLLFFMINFITSHKDLSEEKHRLRIKEKQERFLREVERFEKEYIDEIEESEKNYENKITQAQKRLTII